MDYNKIPLCVRLFYVLREFVIWAGFLIRPIFLSITALFIWLESIHWLFMIIWLFFYWYFLSRADQEVFREREKDYELKRKKEEEKTNKVLNRVFCVNITIIFIFVLCLCINKKHNWTCTDYTSIDYNWNNDMKCVNQNWDIVWTNYDWAKELMWK